MAYGRGTLLGLDFFEQKNGGDDHKTCHSHPAEIIHKSHKRRLADKLLVDPSVNQWVRHTSPGQRQKTLDLLESNLIGWIIGRQVTDQDRLMDLAHPCEHRSRQRDPDPAADVTHQIKKTGGIAHFLFVQSPHRERC